MLSRELMSCHIIVQGECDSKSALISDIELAARLFNYHWHILQLLNILESLINKWEISGNCTAYAYKKKNTSNLINLTHLKANNKYFILCII